MTDMFRMPINRIQVWLPRGVIAACILMFLIIKIFGPGKTHSIKDGNTIIYRCSLLLFIIPIVFGVILCVLAVVNWMRPGWLFKCISIALLVMAIGIFIFAPSMLMTGVVLTPDYFCNRIGFWFSPKETKIEFNSLMFMKTVEAKKDNHGRQQYELQCFMKPEGTVINTPINDLLKKALPEILNIASQHEVVIDENIGVLEN